MVSKSVSIFHSAMDYPTLNETLDFLGDILPSSTTSQPVLQARLRWLNSTVNFVQSCKISAVEKTLLMACDERESFLIPYERCLEELSFRIKTTEAMIHSSRKFQMPLNGKLSVQIAVRCSFCSAAHFTENCGKINDVQCNFDNHRFQLQPQHHSIYESRKVVKENIQQFVSTGSECLIIPPRCFFCSEKHFLYRCEQFKSLPDKARLEVVRDKELCHNCFNDKHCTNQCPKPARCLRCLGKHHTDLCKALQMNVKRVRFQ